MAGNHVYYIGGRSYGWESETVGLTHPFHQVLQLAERSC